jgi:hypothetical protein
MYITKPDFQKSIDRINAFWEREMIDRPPVEIRLPKSMQERSSRQYGNDEIEWRDVDYRARKIARISTTHCILGMRCRRHGRTWVRKYSPHGADAGTTLAKPLHGAIRVSKTGSGMPQMYGCMKTMSYSNYWRNLQETCLIWAVANLLPD